MVYIYTSSSGGYEGAVSAVTDGSIDYALVTDDSSYSYKRKCDKIHTLLLCCTRFKACTKKAVRTYVRIIGIEVTAVPKYYTV